MKPEDQLQLTEQVYSTIHTSDNNDSFTLRYMNYAKCFTLPSWGKSMYNSYVV